MTESEQIVEAWKVAADDLGFEFTAPFELEVEGRKIRYAGLVREFGSDKGMLIFTSENFTTEPWASGATKHGFGYSCLGGSFETYDRDSFIATLDD